MGYNAFRVKRGSDVNPKGMYHAELIITIHSIVGSIYCYKKFGFSISPRIVEGKLFTFLSHKNVLAFLTDFLSSSEK